MKKKILVIVVLLVFISIISYTLAIYRERNSGTATIRGANWSVSTSGNNSLNLTAGSTANYTLTVTNDSEVDVVYDIELTNLPSGIKVKLDSGSYITESNNKITISNAGTLLYGASPKNHILTFTTDLESGVVTDQSVGINVKFKQKLN